MKQKVLIWVVVVWGWLCAQESDLWADITLSKLFRDHMVIQQTEPVRIWGTGDPQATIVVTFRDHESEAIVGADGKWATVIQSGGPGGPHKLEVRTADGQKKIVLSDVLVGEVWICSGQSNMEWRVADAAHADREMELSKEFAAVRLFTVEPRAETEPHDEFGRVRGWDVCGPDTVGSFSAVAYVFGRHLQQRLKVPVGLINVSLGGTRAEAWTSRAALEKDSAFEPLLRHWDQVSDLTSVHRPGNLYNGMIAPLRGCSFRGVIWYQGESNVGRGEQYARLFPALIQNWRQDLAAGEPCPFYFVQIAPFRYEGRDAEELPELWDAQLKSLRSVPETGMVVTTDISELNDIHPSNKQDVGRRLALWALAHGYRESLSQNGSEEEIVPSGPLYREMVIEGNRIRIRFDYAQDELVAGGDGPLTEFTICGADQKFVPAQAQVDGSDVIVWSDDIAEPKAVRFGWRDTAQPNLFNRAGLPASPFRTDDYDLLSAGRSY